jgi:hypothetical protein
LQRDLKFAQPGRLLQRAELFFGLSQKNAGPGNPLENAGRLIYPVALIHA